MAIDLSQERPLRLQEAAKRFPSPRRDGPSHISRLIRLIIDGPRGADGERVYLEAIRVSGQWITTEEAIQRFVERLSPRRPDGARRTPAARDKAVARADA